MVWLSHREAGFFGRRIVDAKSDGPRHWYDGRLDPSEASEAVADVLTAWWEWLPWQDVAPPFPGAISEWPQRLVDGLAVARQEWQALVTWQQWRRTPKDEKK